MALDLGLLNPRWSLVFMENLGSPHYIERFQVVALQIGQIIEAEATTIQPVVGLYMS